MIPTPECRDLILGVIGRAQERYPAILLHALVFLSNHYNLILTTPDAGTMSSFMCFVNSNIAREIGRLVGWREHFWGRRYRPIEILDAFAQEGRLKYLIAQGEKEDLVLLPQDWPGASSILALLHGTKLFGTWHDRTAEFKARKRAKQTGEKVDPRDFETVYEIKLTPLPSWRNWTEDARRARVAAIVEELITEGKARREESGRAPMGVAKILRQDPHGTPSATKRSPAPICHASDHATRTRYRRALYAFVDAYRAASKRIRDGALSAAGRLLPAATSLPPNWWTSNQWTLIV